MKNVIATAAVLIALLGLTAVVVGLATAVRPDEVRGNPTAVKNSHVPQVLNGNLDGVE